MKKIITEAQEHEIEELMEEHKDAMLAFGQEAYIQGGNDGIAAYHRGEMQTVVAASIIFMVIPAAIGFGKKLYLKHKKSKQQEES